jgi:peptide/nickel transport system ATP-binding protein
VPGDDRHETRCLRFEEIDWTAPVEASTQTEGPRSPATSS